MTRNEIIQGVLNLYIRPAYLEIGVDNGFTFNAVKAASKHAVDPAFKYQTKDIETPEVSIKHFSVTSDAYFAQTGSKRLIDVAFIDGLHTFEQTLRDLLNVQAVMKPNGVIFIDDINPPLYFSSLPDEREAFMVRDYQARFAPALAEHNSWMGDVYKLVFFIRTFMQAWSYAVPAETGAAQLMMWREPRPESAVGGRTFAAIGNMTYADFVRDAGALNIQPYDTILARIRSRV